MYSTDPILFHRWQNQLDSSLACVVSKKEVPGISDDRSLPANKSEKSQLEKGPEAGDAQCHI
jgi:hypothetical protein